MEVELLTNQSYHLKKIEVVVFSHITEIIRERYPGYIPVIQGDDSGRHQDEYFKNL